MRHLDIRAPEIQCPSRFTTLAGRYGCGPAWRASSPMPFWQRYCRSWPGARDPTSVALKLDGPTTPRHHKYAGLQGIMPGLPIMRDYVNYAAGPTGTYIHYLSDASRH